MSENELFFHIDDGVEDKKSASDSTLEPWVVCIIDDDEQIHKVTEIVLSSFKFNNRPLKFVNAYSAEAGKELFKKYDNIAVCLLDVIMETEDAGLNLVRYIREDLKNKFTRIILRTGQAGQYPEEKIICAYDINDFKEKTELTSVKLRTLMYSCLRSYQDIITIEHDRNSMQNVINSIGKVFKEESSNQFSYQVLQQLEILLNTEVNAFIGTQSFDENEQGYGDTSLVCGIGEYESIIPVELSSNMNLTKSGPFFDNKNNIFIHTLKGKSIYRYFIYLKLKNEISPLESKLLELYCGNILLAFDAIYLQSEVHDANEANKAKSVFLANMSHEIRTPMNAIIGFTELMGNTELNDKQKSYLESIESGGRGLLKIINDILDLSKIESGKVQIEIELTSLKWLFREIENVFSHAIENKGLSFIIDMDTDLPESIMIDETRLRQIIFNLISNAIKFTEKGAIRIEVRLISSFMNLIKEGYDKHEVNYADIEIHIIDTGIGIPEKFQEQIFHSFEQQDNQSTRKYGGTGLGLAISRKLANLLNGSLSLQSEEGKGSHFKLELNHIEVSQNIISIENETQDNNIKFEPAVILVIDDNDANRKLLVEYLSLHPFTIYEGVNGLEAIELTRSTNPDLILMDIKMPEMTGDVAYDVIKNDLNFKELPIIACTASVLEGVDSRLEKFNDYLFKPIGLKELENKMSHYLKFTEIMIDDKASSSDSSGEIDMGRIQITESMKNELIDSIQSDLKPFVQNIRKMSNFSKYVDIIKRLNDYAEHYGIDEFNQLGERLNSACEQFDIEKIESALNDIESQLELITVTQ